MKLILALSASLFLLGCSASGSWRDASRESAGLAPEPDNYNDAVVQVYAADAWGWRGWFAVHTWIAVKPAAAADYTVYDVVGWRERWGGSVVGSNRDVPDRHWYGAEPELLVDLRGDQAQALVSKIEEAVEAYPWPEEYRVFPGPNSNTFVAWVGKQVPELGLDMPFSAIGSGYASRAEGL